MLLTVFHLSPKENRKPKKCLMQSPNSYFMAVLFPGRYKITIVFGRIQAVVLYVGYSSFPCQPAGQKQAYRRMLSFKDRSSTESILN
jgi:small subunit ribosomal protein S27e